MQAPDEVAAYYMPWYRTFWLTFWALATLGFAVLYYLGLVLGSIGITITGGGLAFASAAICVHLFFVLRLDRPVLRLDDSGFHDARLGASIPWVEIGGLLRHQPGTQVFLDILAEKPERFIEPRRGLARVRPTPKPSKTGGALRATCVGLDMPGDRIVEAAQAWHSFTRQAA